MKISRERKRGESEWWAACIIEREFLRERKERINGFQPSFSFSTVAVSPPSQFDDIFVLSSYHLRGQERERWKSGAMPLKVVHKRGEEEIDSYNSSTSIWRISEIDLILSADHEAFCSWQIGGSRFQSVHSLRVKMGTSWRNRFQSL